MFEQGVTVGVRYSRGRGRWPLGGTSASWIFKVIRSTIPSIRMSSRCLSSRATTSTTVAKVARSTGRAGSAILLGTLVGCGSLMPGAGVTDQHVVTLSTHEFSAQELTGVASGGRIRLDGQCVSLDYGDGNSTNLIWPKAFHALAPPLMIFGASGRLIIKEGDEVELGVAEGRQPVFGCPVRGVFLVGEVTSVNGSPWPDGTPAPPPVQQPGPK